MDGRSDHTLEPADLLDPEIVSLEPTVVLSRDAVPTEMMQTAADNRVTNVVEGSLSGELSELRRRRIGDSAIFIAAVYGVMALWYCFTKDGEYQLIWILMAVRFLFAACVAALVFSRVFLTHSQLRVIEYLFFGGMTFLLCLGQYYINMNYLEYEKKPAAMLVYSKNGVIQLYSLMVLYGLFIPNTAKTAAQMVLSMALALVATQTLVLLHPFAQTELAKIGTDERMVTNAVIICVAASLTIYGAHILNGLRFELHEAKKYGQYQLRHKIGTGGMGDVYLAEHELLKRPCALKLIKPETGSDPMAVARFEREVQSAARLNHPNTIDIFDYGHTQDGTFYYVMELLHGMNLGDLVEEYGPMPPGRLIFILRQVCAGMSQAHAFGLVHRDLKPANIYVAQVGGVYDFAKVLDFGLVKITKDPGAIELTAERTISGTPMFMPPEQAAGDRGLGPPADIYALGAIAYYALTGRPPFLGDSAWAVMISHARDPVLPPSQVKSDVPADLEQVILRCLQKKPEDRYANVKELGRAIAACKDATGWSEDQAEVWWSTKLKTNVAS